MESNVPREPFEISRDELYEQVWTTPLDHLGKKFGVSGSYLARVCDALRVPRPPVGYWQKKSVGKAKPRPELPVALPGDQLTWSKDRQLAAPRRSRAQPDTSDSAATKLTRTRCHAFLVGVDEHFRKSRRIEEGEFLRPYKLLLPDIVASETSLVKAIDLANEVFSALKRKGHRVLFAPPDQRMRRASIEERETPGKDRRYGRYSTASIWSPHRPTITYIGSTPIGLALTEMTERVALRYMNGKYFREDSDQVRFARPHQLTNSWISEHDRPCDRFRLVAYSPLHGVDWSETWQETTENSLRSMIPEIILRLEASTDKLQALMTAAEKEAARQQHEWDEAQERSRRNDDRRRVAQALVESHTQLTSIMEKWAAAMNVERFFQEAEMRIQSLEGERRIQLRERLALARSMLGTLDPLDHLKEWLAPEERYRSKYVDG